MKTTEMDMISRTNIMRTMGTANITKMNIMRTNNIIKMKGLAVRIFHRRRRLHIRSIRVRVPGIGQRSGGYIICKDIRLLPKIHPIQERPLRSRLLIPLRLTRTPFKSGGSERFLPRIATAQAGG